MPRRPQGEPKGSQNQGKPSQNSVVFWKAFWEALFVDFGRVLVPSRPQICGFRMEGIAKTKKSHFLSRGVFFTYFVCFWNNLGLILGVKSVKKLSKNNIKT